MDIFNNIRESGEKSVRYMWQTSGGLGVALLNGASGGAGGSPNSSFGNLFGGPNADLSTMFNRLFVFAITVGAILAVIRLVYGGAIYMTKDVWSAKQSAVTIIQQAMIGLLLLLAVYLILFQINPQILKLEFLSGKPAGATGASGSLQATSPFGTNNTSATNAEIINTTTANTNSLAPDNFDPNSPCLAGGC